jgi:hypothetical protein
MQKPSIRRQNMPILGIFAEMAKHYAHFAPEQFFQNGCVLNGALYVTIWA